MPQQQETFSNVQPVQQLLPAAQSGFGDSDEKFTNVKPLEQFTKAKNLLDTSKPASTGLLDTLSDSPALAPQDRAVVGAAKAVRGAYHGLMGVEESPISRGNTTTASPAAVNLGFTPEHLGHEVGDTVRSIGKFGLGVVKDINSSMPIVSENEWGSTAKEHGYKGPTFVQKYIEAPSEVERQKALEEAQKYHDTHGWESFSHLLNTYIHTAGELVPMVGPLAGSIIDKAQGGDIGGALAQTAALYAGSKLAPKGLDKGTELLKRGVRNSVETPEVTTAKANADSLAKDLAEKQKTYDAAKGEHDKYAASTAQGVRAPKAVVKALEEAGADLTAAQFHHDAALDAVKRAQASQLTIPQRIGAVAGRTVGNLKKIALPGEPEEVPTQDSTAQPSTVRPLGARAASAPAKPINVKGPGDVEPEEFPQEPTDRPLVPIGQRELAGGQGRMGKIHLLPEASLNAETDLTQEVLPPARTVAQPTTKEPTVIDQIVRNNPKAAAVESALEGPQFKKMVNEVGEKVRQELGGSEPLKPNIPLREQAKAGADAPTKLSSDPRKATLQKANATPEEIQTILSRGSNTDPTSKVGLSNLAGHFGVDLGDKAIGRSKGDIKAGTHLAPHEVLQRIINAGHTPTDISNAVEEGRHLPKVSGGSSEPDVAIAPQGGHAGNGVSSVEELSRPGKHYVVGKMGDVTYHGKSFAPESTPIGKAHVTVLPDGTFRINDGHLTQTGRAALNKAVHQ